MLLKMGGVNAPEKSGHGGGQRSWKITYVKPSSVRLENCVPERSLKIE